MTGQLRYELIGDASQFSSAAQEVIQGSQQIEGSLEALEGNIAAVTEGQIQLNEAAGRFRDSSGQFVSGAEAQARVLEELNSEGVQTTQQIREQIERLERLESIYQEDAKASSELSDRQQQLRTQLTEVGAAAAQQNRDLSRLDQQFGEATVEMTDFANRQSRLQSELRATAAAQERVQSSGVTMRSSVRASANNLGFEFVQAAQDARFGAAGVANQIPLMTEQFTQLQAKTGSTTAALRALGSSFFGTAGIIGAITLGLPLLEDLASGFGEAQDSASDFQESVQSAADSVFELADASREGLTLTQQFGRSTISTLETTISQLQTQLNRLRDRDPIRPGIGAPAPGFLTVESFAPQQELNQLSESQEVRDSAVETIREQIEQRRVINLLLEAQVQSIMDASTLSAEQAESLQNQSATLKTITAALQQDVIATREAKRLAESRLQSTESIAASQAVINQLVSREVASFTDILNAAQSTKRQRQLINQALDEGLVSQERANSLLEEYKNDTSEATDETGRQAEAMNALSVSAKQAAENMVTVRRALDSMDQMPMQRRISTLGAGRTPTIGGTMLNQGRSQGDLMLQAARDAGLISEFGTLQDTLGGVQQESQSAFSAVQLGAQAATSATNALTQSLARGESFARGLQGTFSQLLSQVGSSLLQKAITGGSALGLSGGPLAAIGIGGGLLGGILGSFESGGTFPSTGVAAVHPPELALGEKGTQIIGREETEQILANARRQPAVDLNIESQLIRLPNGDLGVAVREAEQRNQQYQS